MRFGCSLLSRSLHMVSKRIQNLTIEAPKLSGRESPVESIPVGKSEKLSQHVPQFVGDFYLIPTSWSERAQLIGSTHAGIRERGVHTKSANKGWELVAKW